MARYIDADALIDRMKKDPLFPLVERYGVTGVIEAEPTADVVPVVRCEDCKHLVRSEGVCKLLSNNYEPPVYVEDDDFCSRGERRTYGEEA